MNKVIEKTKGFTLVEIMIVVAIVGILATVITFSLGASRVKARDAARLQDLENFAGALETYFAQNNHYPYTTCSGSDNWASYDNPAYSSNLVCDTLNGPGRTLAQFMAPYLKPLKDPKGVTGDAGYYYVNQTGGGSYCFLIWRTPENLNDFPPKYIPANRCAAWNSDGKCTTAGGAEAIFIGEGTYASSC